MTSVTDGPSRLRNLCLALFRDNVGDSVGGPANGSAMRGVVGPAVALAQNLAVRGWRVCLLVRRFRKRGRSASAIQQKSGQVRVRSGCTLCPSNSSRRLEVVRKRMTLTGAGQQRSVAGSGLEYDNGQVASAQGIWSTQSREQEILPF